MWYHFHMNILKNVDYEKGINELAENSIDFICIDPPYGKIQGMKLSGQKSKVDWDVNIDWKQMFKLFNRILRPGGTIAVFGQQPTYSEMVLSNHKDFKFEYIWVKNNAAQGFHSNKMPLNFTENIAIFVKNGNNRTFNKPTTSLEINKDEHHIRWYAQQIYNFIDLPRRKIHEQLGHRKTEFFFYYTGKNFGIPSEEVYDQLIETFNINEMENFISYKKLKEIWSNERDKTRGIKLDGSVYNGTFRNVLEFSKDNKPYFHPTQKPIKLMEELIKIHTNENDVVLDCFAGSGSTLVAAKNLKRKYIGFELSKEYFEIAKSRLEKAKL